MFGDAGAPTDAAIQALPHGLLSSFGYLTHDTLLISLGLLPLAIATNFLGFWLVLRMPTEIFYRIFYALIFLISASILTQGVIGLLRGWAIISA